MRILNASKGITLAQNSKVADGFWSRFRGLLGTATLPVGEGLVIRSCSSVHTLGMKYPIDVLFISKQNQVLRVIHNMPPGRTAVSHDSEFVVELPAGLARTTETWPGDILELYP